MFCIHLQVFAATKENCLNQKLFSFVFDCLCNEWSVSHSSDNFIESRKGLKSFAGEWEIFKQSRWRLLSKEFRLTKKKPTKSFFSWTLGLFLINSSFSLHIETSLADYRAGKSSTKILWWLFFLFHRFYLISLWKLH